jgi:hypothetical protein
MDRAKEVLPVGATRVFQWKVANVMNIQAEADALQQRIRQLGGERAGNYRVSTTMSARKDCEWSGPSHQSAHTLNTLTWSFLVQGASNAKRSSMFVCRYAFS